MLFVADLRSLIVALYAWYVEDGKVVESDGENQIKTTGNVY